MVSLVKKECCYICNTGVAVEKFYFSSKTVWHFSKKQRPVTRSEYSRAMSPSPFDRTALPYFVGDMNRIFLFQTF